MMSYFVRSDLWNSKLSLFPALRYARTTDYELIFKAQKREIISHLTGIGHEKQNTISYHSG